MNPAPPSTAVPPYSAAIFDMDGLLIDSERPIRDLFLANCERHGVQFSLATYSQVIGRNRVDSERLLRDGIGDPLLYEAIVAATRRDIDTMRAAGCFPLKPGVADLLEAIAARGVPIGVASSTQRVHVEERLAAVEVLQRFVAVNGGDEVVHGKPAPDLFLLAARRLAVPAHRCLVFEDSRAGAMGALAAGMGVVVVPDLQQPDCHVRQRSLAVLGSLLEARAWVDHWFD